MINLLVYDIFNIQEEIGKLFQAEMPFALSYKVSRLVRDIEPEYKIAQETRAKLVQKYCSKDENGDPALDASGKNLLISPENIEKYNEEMTGLLNTEIEIACEKLPEQVTEYIIAAPSTIDSLTKIVDMKN